MAGNPSKLRLIFQHPASDEIYCLREPCAAHQMRSRLAEKPTNIPVMTSSSGISAETISTHPSRSGQALHQQGLGKWKAVRPWKPPESADSVRDSLDMDGAGSVGTGEQRGERNASPRLRLEVVDVSSTAVSLAFFTEQEQHTDDDTEETSTQAAQRPSRASDAHHEGASVSGSQPCTPSAISIKVNSAPWPHVAHSGPLLGDIRGRHEGIHDTQATAEGAIVVYGLEPGSLYEVELDALGETIDSFTSSVCRSAHAFRSRRAPTTGSRTEYGFDAFDRSKRLSSSPLLIRRSLSTSAPPHRGRGTDTPKKGSGYRKKGRGSHRIVYPHAQEIAR